MPHHMTSYKMAQEAPQSVGTGDVPSNSYPPRPPPPTPKVCNLQLQDLTRSCRKMPYF